MNVILARIGLVLAILLVLADPAQAYVGPGAGLTAIGSILGILVTVFLVIVGFVWYPIKRLRQSLRNRKQKPE